MREALLDIVQAESFAPIHIKARSVERAPSIDTSQPVAGS
jgi:hypothetical protein